MKRTLMSLALLMLIVRLSAVTSTTAGGNWNDPSTWIGGVCPNSTEPVIINGPVKVWDTSCGSITINPGATLNNHNSNVLVVEGDFVNNGTYLSVSAPTTIGGNIIQNGTWESYTVNLQNYSSTQQEITTVYPLKAKKLILVSANNLIIHGNLYLEGTYLDLNKNQLIVDDNAVLNFNGGSLYGGYEYNLPEYSINKPVVFNFSHNASICSANLRDAVFNGNAVLGSMTYTNSQPGGKLTVKGNLTVADTLSSIGFGENAYGMVYLTVTGNLTNNGLIRGNENNSVGLSVNANGNLTNNGSMLNNTISANTVTNNGTIKKVAYLKISNRLVNNGTIRDGYANGQNMKMSVIFQNAQAYTFLGALNSVVKNVDLQVYTNMEPTAMHTLTLEGNLNIDSSIVKGTDNTGYVPDRKLIIASDAAVKFTDSRLKMKHIFGQGNSISFAGKNFLRLKSIQDCDFSGNLWLRTYNYTSSSADSLAISGSVAFNDSVNADSLGAIRVNGTLTNNGWLGKNEHCTPAFSVKGEFVNNGIFDLAISALEIRSNSNIRNFGNMINAIKFANSSQSGSFINHGQMKVLYSSSLPTIGSFVNLGTVFNSSPSFTLRLSKDYISKGNIINSPNCYSLIRMVSEGYQPLNQQIIYDNTLNQELMFSPDDITGNNRQWYKNGVAMPGEDANSLFLNNLTTDNFGTYVYQTENGNSRKFIVGNKYKIIAKTPVNGGIISGESIDLSWQSAPGAVEYKVQIATNPEFTESVQLFESIEQNSFTLSNLPSSTYYWRVSARTAYAATREYVWLDYSEAQSFSFQSSSISEAKSIISSLSQNYPNPFNPTTQINFSTQNTGKVNLNIFNAKGEMVKELINANLPTGNHSVKFEAAEFNSGIYFYQIKTADQTITKKMILQK